MQRAIEGTATISLAELDDLRLCREQIKEYEAEIEKQKEMLSHLIQSIDTTEFDKINAETDAAENNLTDKQIDERVKLADSKLILHINERELRRLIKRGVVAETSEAHFALSKMTLKEFENIKIMIGGQDNVI